MLPTPLGKGALQNPAIQPPRQVSLSIVFCGWACVTSRNEGKHVGGGGHTCLLIPLQCTGNTCKFSLLCVQMRTAKPGIDSARTLIDFSKCADLPPTVALQIRNVGYYGGTTPSFP